MAKMTREEVVLSLDKALLLAGVAPLLLDSIKRLINQIKGESVSIEVDRDEMNKIVDRLVSRQDRIDAA